VLQVVEDFLRLLLNTMAEMCFINLLEKQICTTAYLCITNVKGRSISAQAWTGPECSTITNVDSCINSFCSLSYDRSVASSKASSPQGAI
jgi:hypothetical protein